jgi:acyl-CoA synthetase (AMP-forming)/AMP-acid ligase II
VNFATDIVEAAPPGDRALVELARDGSRREWTFGEVTAAAGALAARLTHEGVKRGDVVLTLIGNRPEWVLTMVACFRQGFVVLPCNEQLRPHDLAQRLRIAEPRLVVADERNAEVLTAAASPRASCTPSATCAASACRPRTGSTPARASSSGARPPPAGRSRPATSSSPPGCAAPQRSCTTPGSIPASASSSSSGKA